MNQTNIIKDRVAEIQTRLDTEKAWWENRRAGIQSDFMKELEADVKPVDTSQRKTGSDDDAVLVDADGPAQAQGGKKKNRKK